MHIFYEKNLNGKQVKVDEANVHIDATRYPVRNIAMIHVEKAKPPDFTKAQAQVMLSICAVLLGFSVNFFTIFNPLGFVFMLPGAYMMYTAHDSIELSFHSVKFGNSASDKDVVVLYPATKEMLKPYIFFNTLNWDSYSASTYREITQFADSVSESIDNLRNQSRE